MTVAPRSLARRAMRQSWLQAHPGASGNGIAPARDAAGQDDPLRTTSDARVRAPDDLHRECTA